MARLKSFVESGAMKRLWLATGLAVALAAPAWAGFWDGVGAYNRGDYQTALREWTPVAEQGDGLAQNNLGILYDEGHGVAQDFARAAAWYRKAAEQGHDDAQNNLARLYENGLGVEQDLVRAHMWYNLAATRGNGAGLDNMDGVAAKMAEAEIGEALSRAREWLILHPKK